MKVRLLKDARIQHKAGEIVEVSPVVADFLTSTFCAEPVPAEKPKPVEKEKTAEKTTTRKGRK